MKLQNLQDLANCSNFFKNIAHSLTGIYEVTKFGAVQKNAHLVDLKKKKPAKRVFDSKHRYGLSRKRAFQSFSEMGDPKLQCQRPCPVVELCVAPILF